MKHNASWRGWGDHPYGILTLDCSEQFLVTGRETFPVRSCCLDNGVLDILGRKVTAQTVPYELAVSCYRLSYSVLTLGPLTLLTQPHGDFFAMRTGAEGERERGSGFSFEGGSDSGWTRRGE